MRSQACLLALCLLPAACTLPRETIEGTDSSTFFAAGRASWEISTPKEVEGSRKRSQTLVDFDISTSRSDFTQQVSPGAGIEIGNQLFAGPDSVDIDFDMLRLSMDLRQSIRADSGAGIEFFLGLGYSDLDLSGTNGILSSSQSFDGWGPLLGAALFYEPVDWLRLYGEGSVNPTIVESAGDFADLNTLELGASFRLAKHMALRAAWRQQTYEISNDEFDSDLDLEASGPALTLWFNF